ncbi:MAG: hypothetical protein A2W25_12025 [candidate division Zixibacteria bacterium RBG_16_53_22]|nr:MAG: hypothetical protein A2W25_12025 [candidate division Zixibacteria bacterium RBG_16_53_22]
MRPKNRPAISYYGGKWNLAPWIISFFPDHYNYVDLCGGAASVLIRKPRSRLETYNDIDRNVVNFFRVLRDQPDELIHKINLTPWSRIEYELHRVETDDDVERARRFWVGCCMAITHMAYTVSGMVMTRNVDHAPGNPACLVNMDVSYLRLISDRFKGVQIECQDYCDIVAMYDHPNNLLYLDPPYMKSGRTFDNLYAVEWSDDDHIKAAETLCNCDSYVLVSGYACDLYTALYEAHGFVRFDRKAKANKGTRIESVWLSPRTVSALDRPFQVSLY